MRPRFDADDLTYCAIGLALVLAAAYGLERIGWL